MDRHEQFPVGERPSLDLRVPVGVIEVHVGDTGIVQLTVDCAAAADFEIIKTGDRVSLRHPSRWSMRGRSCRIVATVPSGTDVNVEAASAEVRLAGRLGAVDVRIGLPSGIRVEADLSTVSGRASLPDPAAAGGDRRPVRLRLKTVSGDIRVERTT